METEESKNDVCDSNVTTGRAGPDLSSETDPRLGSNLIPPKKTVNPPFYLEILKYILPKGIPNKSSLEEGVIIEITEKFYIFITNGFNSENNAHAKIIKFGREGHVTFEGRDKSISRNQFELILDQNSTKIVCHCPPPKLPTSFLITHEPFYLTQNNVNLKNNHYI